jgi:multidrug efflux system outer membrane protein
VSREELAQADALVHTAGARIPDLERLIAQKENQISILLGNNPQPIRRGKSLPELAVRPTVPAGLPSDLLERRPDIRQSEAVLIAANYRIGAARANFFPRIALTGQGGTQSVDLSLLFTGASTFWNIGAIATLPIFTGGFNYFTLQATYAQKEQALTLYQSTVRQAFREVSDGLVAHARFQEFLAEQQALVESYREYAVLANKRFKGGLESFLSVLDSERQLFGAKLDLAAVQRDRLLTLVQLYKALGGGAEIPGEPQAAENAAAPPSATR